MDVDWEKTQAYAVGLGGIYINLSGRESRGTVQPGEEKAKIKAAIAKGLRELLDQEKNSRPVGDVYDTAEAYVGPYVEEAPDLIVGFNPGYRVSWSCATGIVTESIFQDNEKSWSGDHCMDPPQIPGILFSNQPIGVESPSIMDLAPTVLDLFGVGVPPYCDGKSMLPASPERSLDAC